MDPAVQAFIFMGVIAIGGTVLFFITPIVLLWLAIRWQRNKLIQRRTEEEKKVYLQKEQRIKSFLYLILIGWFLVLYPFLFGFFQGDFRDIIDYLLFFSHLVFGFLLIRSIIYRSRLK